MNQRWRRLGRSLQDVAVVASVQRPDGLQVRDDALLQAVHEACEIVLRAAWAAGRRCKAVSGK